MPAKRKTNFCRRGHELTPDNTLLRHDRNGSIECVACKANGRKAFKLRKPLYDVWKTMIRRTVDPTFKDWHLYGGRGIKVCERWMKSYEDFVHDVGPRPSLEYTLDREDGTKGYEPGNVRWATAKQQARNMRTNHMIEFNGDTRTIAEWAELTGMKYLTLFMRLKRGMSVSQTITAKVGSVQPYMKRKRNEKGQFKDPLTLQPLSDRTD